MKKSTLWLLAGVGAMVMASLALCCAFAPDTVDNDFDSGSIAANTSDIDLEALTQVYKQYVKTGAKDLNGFEQMVNKPEVYKGAGHLDVTLDDQGQVLGYVNKDQDPTYDSTKDEMVFAINADKKNEQIVARDRHNYYYRRPVGSGFFTGYLLGSMLTRQRSFYGGRYWSAPAGARYMNSGYYSSGRRGSVRSGSSRSRGGRSGSRSGGFSFGK